MRQADKKRTGWFRTSLFPQLIVPILLVTLTVLLFTTLSNNLFFRDTLIRTFWASEQNYMTTQAGNLETLLGAYSNQLYGAAVDSRLLKLARGLDEAGASQRSKLERSAREYLETVIFGTDVSAATLALEDGSFISYTRLQDTQNWPSWFSTTAAGGYDEALAELCRRAGEARRAVVGTVPRRYSRSGISLIHLACPVYDLLTRVSYGTIILSVNTANLCETVNPASAEDHYAQGILTDAEGVIIAHADAGFAYGAFRAEDGRVLTADDRGVVPEDPLIMRRDLNRLGFVLYRIGDQNRVRQRARSYSLSLLLITAPVLIVLLAAVALLLRRWMRSILRLRQGINAISSGDLGVRVPVTDGTEIGQITEAFNHMARELSQARAREAEQARRALDALNRQRTAEIRALENQINSHFLYNTLNTINYTAVQSGSLNTSRQIKHLANMLRYTFQNSEEIVSAASEASWLGEYLALQKLRFGDSFDYSIRVDPRVADWPMRKLIVQPFVENSVLHGFEGMDGGGLLSVAFLPYREGLMRVVVRDNGRGMPPEQLRALKARFADARLPDANGIGLENARQRLLSYYGGRARVLLRSWPGQGTAIVLLLP